MKRWTHVAAFLLFVITPGFFYTPAVHAFTVRSSEFVTVTDGETVNGSVFLAGQKITMDGTVNGDVYCAGQDIRISGTVSGDVLCAGQNVTISGIVLGNVMSAGQLINTAGTILKNESIFGQQITQGASVSGELIAAGQNLTIKGSIARDAMIFGQAVTVNAITRGSVNITAESVTFGEGARADNTVTYESPKEATVAPGSSVSGSLRFIKTERPDPGTQDKRSWPQHSNAPRPLSGLLWITFTFFTALLLMKIAPTRMNAALSEMESNTLRTMGVGFLWLILTPALILTLALTILGIPLAVIAGIAYACAIVFSRIFSGLTVGRVLVDGYWKQQKDSVPIVAAVGLLVSWLIFKVPLVGDLASGAAVIWGIGGIVRFFRSTSPGKLKR